jgi:hypothetical protein
MENAHIGTASLLQIALDACPKGTLNSTKLSSELEAFEMSRITNALNRYSTQLVPSRLNSSLLDTTRRYATLLDATLLELDAT